MNIAYILPSLSGAAPVAVIELLSRLMTQYGHTCIVYYFDDKVELSFNCRTEKIDTGQSMDFSRFDVVHSTGMRPDIFVAKHREYSGRTKYVTTIHNFFIEDFTSQYNWFVAQVFGRRWMSKVNRFDVVTVLSNVGVTYYNKWITKPKLTFAYNARMIDETLQLTEQEKQILLKFKGNSILIGTNAMLSPIKGIDQLIKVLPQLHNHKLFIVGDGKSREELEALTIKLGVANRCYFAGFCKNAYRYLSFYDIYATPSHSEGFSLSSLEAAQFKKNTILSDIPIFREIFDEQEVSFFTLNNTESLVEAINRATNNNQLGDKMYQRFLKCYTPEKMYQRYLTIYYGEI